MTGRSVRRGVAGVATALVLVGITTIGTAGVAHAADRAALGEPVLCPVDELSVPESTRGVVSEWLDYGESISVEPLDDQIWAGVWLTGNNGPEGWPNTHAPSSYPLPGSPEYSLIAQLGNGPNEYLGTAAREFTNSTPGVRKRVSFRVNDNVPGNGNGAFTVFVYYPCH